MENYSFRIEKQNYIYETINGQVVPVFQEYGIENGYIFGNISIDNVGHIGILFYNEEIEIGPTRKKLFVEELNRNKGYGNYLVKTAVEYAKVTCREKNIPTKRMTAKINANNIASKRILENNGFKLKFGNELVSIYELDI